MRNISIHLAKLIAALGVVGVHTRLSSAYENDLLATLSEFFIRLAVPLFFMISGYFFYSNILVRGAHYGKSYFRRLIFIILIWGSLYFFRFCFQAEMAKNYDTLGFASAILHRFIAYGGYYHFWFLTSLIGSCIVLWIITKKDWLNKRCLIICALLYLCGYYFDNIYRLLPPIESVKMIQTILGDIFSGAGRNFLFFGTPLVILGAAIHKYECRIISWSRHLKLKLLLASIAALLCEIWIIFVSMPQKSTTIYLFLPIVAAMLLIVLLSNPLKGHERHIPHFLLAMDLSLGIYIIHPYLLHIYRLMHWRLATELTTIIVFVASMLIIFMLKKMIRIKAITQYF